MAFPKYVRVVDVGPRDGLQNEVREVSIAARIALVEALAAAGVPSIEAGAFVSPKWVPQMAGSDRVLRGIQSRPGVTYPVLTPNLQGLEDALAAGAREVAVFGAASEAFSQKNINCSIDESLRRFEVVTERARSEGVRIRGYVSCVLGCPYQGHVPVADVVHVAERLVELGCYEVSLGDTIGVGTAGQARAMVAEVAKTVPMSQLAVHFHDTYAQALANIYAVLELGIATVDTAVAGLGGCPFAKGASGNVATEDVVYMLNGLGIETGIELEQVAVAGRRMCAELGRRPVSRVSRALAAKQELAQEASEQLSCSGG